MAVPRTSLSEGIALAQWLARLSQMRQAKSRQSSAPAVRRSTSGRKVYPTTQRPEPIGSTVSGKTTSVGRTIRRGPGGSALERWTMNKSPLRYRTTGAGQRKTAQQKIDYMRKGLKVQAEVAKEVRQSALSDILAYKRARDAEKGSGAISQMEQMLTDKLRGQTTEGGLPAAPGKMELLKPLPEIPQNMEDWNLEEWMRVNSMLQEGQL